MNDTALKTFIIEAAHDLELSRMFSSPVFTFLRVAGM